MNTLMFISLVSTKSWKKVFAQDIPYDFRSVCSIEACSFLIWDNNFIDFDSFRHFRQFYFKLSWEAVQIQTGGDADMIARDSLEWRQWQHPLASQNSDMNPSSLGSEIKKKVIF